MMMHPEEITQVTCVKMNTKKFWPVPRQRSELQSTGQLASPGLYGKWPL